MARSAVSAQRPDGAATIGFALVAIGVLTMAGWLLRERAILDALPGYRMVFNTALCFALAGAALTADSLSPASSARIRTALGALILLAGAAVLAQHLFGTDLGIDWPALHDWNVDGNPYPGRMAPATTMGFLLAGAGFVAMDRVRGSASAWIVRALAAVLGAFGALTLAGHVLALRHVYETYLFAYVAVSTAIGFALVGAGQALAWRRHEWHQALRRTSEGAGIMAESAAIALGVALVAAIAGFATMQRGATQQLHRLLEGAIQDHEETIRGEVARGRNAALLVATRPNVRRLLRAAAEDREGAREELRRVADTFIPFGYASLAFLGPAGNALAAVGTSAAEPQLRVALAPPQGGELLWRDGVQLEVRQDFAEGSERLGSLVARLELPAITTRLQEASAIGGTAEVALCAAAGSRMDCFPSRFFQQPIRRTRDFRGAPLPMAHALAGKRGVLRGFDYRGVEVVAAYSPVGDTGLGLVVKVNGAELYAPIRQRLGWLALLLAATVGAGMALLRMRVAPLAERLARREEQLRFALEGSGLALWEWKAASGNIFLGAEWREMLGGDARESVMTLDGLGALVHPEDREAVFDTLRQALKGDVPRYDVEHRVLDLSGQWLWIRSRGEVVERDASGRALRMVGTNAAISERKERELRFAHGATHDALTGLPNRALFEDLLERAHARAKRRGSLMAVLYLDIDRFKNINDTFGHAVGDELLRHFAERLSACVRTSDTVARLGGDEFTAILENLASRHDGHRIAEKIVAAMRPPFALETGALVVTTSVGIAFCPGNTGASAAAIAKRADEALYAAKAGGRDRWQAAA